MSFWQNLSRGLGLKADSLPSEPYQSDDPYKNPQNMDSGGYTDRLPRGKWALDYQYLANKNAEQRRQALWGDAQNALRQGADMMQTYRAGGSAALASGVYGQKASIYGTQAMNTEAPDLLIAWRDRLRQQADAERQQANSFTRAMAVFNAYQSSKPLVGTSPSNAQGAPAQLGDTPTQGDGSSMSLGGPGGGGGSIGMPGGGGGGGGIVGQPIGGGGGGVGGGLLGGSVGAPGSAPAVDGSTPVGRAGNAIIGGGGGGGGDGAANAAHGYNTSSGMKGDKVGKRIIGGGGGGGAGGGGPGGMDTFTHGEAAGRAMGAASPGAQGGVYQALAGDPGSESSTMLMQISARNSMAGAMKGDSAGGIFGGGAGGSPFSGGGGLFGVGGGGGGGGLDLSSILGSLLSVL